MKAEDLIQDCWYKISYSKYSNYIKFEKVELGKIYSYGFFITPNYIKPYMQSRYFCEVLWFEGLYDGVCYEIDISYVIEYLPFDNIDKINYLRKQRIEKLLNI